MSDLIEAAEAVVNAWDEGSLADDLVDQLRTALNQTELRTPTEWLATDRAYAGMGILDPDGWRSGPLGAKSFDEPIGREEMAARFSMCTVGPIRSWMHHG